MEVEEAAAAATRRVHLRTARRPARLMRPRALAAALIVAHGHNAQPHLGKRGRCLTSGVICAGSCNSCSSGCAQRTELRVPRALRCACCVLAPTPSAPRALPTFFLAARSPLCCARSG